MSEMNYDSNFSSSTYRGDIQNEQSSFDGSTIQLIGWQLLGILHTSAVECELWDQLLLCKLQ